MQIGIGLGLTLGRRGGAFDPASLLTSSNGFYFDFTTGATGAGIASVTSKSPSTKSATQATSSKQPVWTDAASDYALFDGVDDVLTSDLVPAASLTLCVCFRAGGTSQLTVGGSNSGTGLGRAYLGTNGSGALGGGWGSQNFATITAGSSITGTDVVGLIRGSASTVELWRDGASIYSAAPSGSPDTSQVMGVGAILSGSAANFLAGRIYRAFAVQSYVSDANIVPLMRAVGAGVVNF